MLVVNNHAPSFILFRLPICLGVPVGTLRIAHHQCQYDGKQCKTKLRAAGKSLPQTHSLNMVAICKSSQTQNAYCSTAVSYVRFQQLSDHNLELLLEILVCVVTNIPIWSGNVPECAIITRKNTL